MPTFQNNPQEYAWNQLSDIYDLVSLILFWPCTFATREIKISLSLQLFVVHQ